MLARTFLALLAVAALVVGGCAPETGDACRTNAQCPRGLVCDTSARGYGGYCTLFDCATIGCPSDAVCVEFEAISACMKPCKRRSDCRTDDGMVCREDVGDRAFCYAPGRGPWPEPAEVPILPPEQDVTDVGGDATPHDVASDAEDAQDTTEDGAAP